MSQIEHPSLNPEGTLLKQGRWSINWLLLFILIGIMSWLFPLLILGS